ncbi:hypothetical protein ACER0A_002445 [Haloimpatiens sp. FM7315]|uniref:hypothetical protein n=1 Tax=Haloimpatiens sp. FM7315 TaxID=3298609 RepID=UPI0035A2BD9E
MKNNVMDCMKHIIDFYEVNRASEIIENYTLKAVDNFIKGEESEENLACFLGNLSFLYSKEEVELVRIKKFVKNLSKVFPYSSVSLVNHISNFMEIILIYRKELTSFYLKILYDLKDYMEEDYSSILYRACALACFKNYINKDMIEKNIIFPWRYDYEMCCFNLTVSRHFEALSYINKAINICPPNLKKSYEEYKEKVITSLKTVRN